MREKQNKKGTKEYMKNLSQIVQFFSIREEEKSKVKGKIIEVTNFKL